MHHAGLAPKDGGMQAAVKSMNAVAAQASKE
jgi:hypothetical protein